MIQALYFQTHLILAESFHYLFGRSGSAMVLIWILVGQGHTALAVGAVGGCLEFCFSHLSFPFSFSLSPRDGPI